MRILTIGHSYCVAVNRGIVREVARNPEFEVTVAAPTYFHGDLRPVNLEPEPPSSPLRLVPLPSTMSRFIHLFRYNTNALRGLLRNEHFDLVHAWEEPYILAGYQIARALEGYSARFCFRTAQSYVKWYPPPFGYFERIVLARAQGWIAGAGLVYEAMLRRGFPKEKGRILNLAVDFSQFQPLSCSSREAVISELRLQPPVVGFVGRLTQAKGLDVLMQAMEQIGGARPWSLLLLGSGEYQDRIQAWAAQQGWMERVRIKLARHDEVPRYLGCMDLMVAPSQTMKNWREQFGRMIIEAFACGVPVIGSDSGEIPYIIGTAGRIVPEGDVAAWAKTISQLLDDPQDRKRMRSLGLSRATQYSTATVAEQYQQYYHWLVSQPV